MPSTTDPMPIKKFGMEVTIDRTDWFCQYCNHPLGDQAVTTLGGFAHRGCDPIMQMIDREVSRAYDDLSSIAQSPKGEL